MSIVQNVTDSSSACTIQLDILGPSTATCISRRGVVGGHDSPDGGWEGVSQHLKLL